MKPVREFFIYKKNNTWPKALAGLTAISLLIIIINIFVSPIRGFFYTLSSPIQKTFWLAGELSSSFLGSFLKAGYLAKENESLKNENQKLLVKVASLQSIERGNQAQTNVSVACQNRFKTVMAGVIGLDDQDMLSINKGLEDGVLAGMPVINEQNVLFGRVHEVYKNLAKIMLISNKNSVVNVEIQQDDSKGPAVHGVVKGSGGLSAYLDLIPITSSINPQDVLLTSSTDPLFPKDVLVARINKIEKDDQKPFQKAEITLFPDIKSTDNLFVITNYKQQD